MDETMIGAMEIGEVDRAVDAVGAALDEIGSVEIEGTTTPDYIGAPPGQKRRVSLRQTNAKYTLDRAKGDIARLSSMVKGLVQKAKAQVGEEVKEWASTSGAKAITLRYQATGAAGTYQVSLGNSNLTGTFSALVVFSGQAVDLSGIQVGGAPIANPDSSISLSAATQGIEVAIGARPVTSGNGISATVVTSAANQVVMFHLLRKPTPQCGPFGIRYFNT